MPGDVSRACACFLLILAYTLGGQDIRNVTTWVGTWHPGGLEIRSPTSGRATDYLLSSITPLQRPNTIFGQRFATITLQYAIDDGRCHTPL